MEAFILDNIPFQVNMESLLDNLRIKEKSPYADRFKQLLEEAVAIAKPKVMYKEVSIESKGDNYVVIDGVKFSSRVVRVNLDDVLNLFPAIATCGKELEQWANSLDDILENFWAATICEAALRSAIAVLEAHLSEKFNLPHISKMNPGSVIDWSITEQSNLFKILGSPKDSIGVELTESSMMLPAKSVSGIWFPEENFENCMLCSKKCSHRKAPYDPHMYDERYGS